MRILQVCTSAEEGTHSSSSWAELYMPKFRSGQSERTCGGIGVGGGDIFAPTCFGPFGHVGANIF